MDIPLTDRRRDTRFRHDAVASTRAMLRPGYLVSLVDLSAGGALIEGPRPLRPGARVHLQLTQPHRTLGIPALVVRCSVAAIDSDLGVVYRGALRFDRRSEVLWEGWTRGGYDVPSQGPAAADGDGQALPADEWAAGALAE